MRMTDLCRVCEAETDAPLCKHCTLEVSRAVGQIPALMHEVSLLATRQTRVYRATGARGPDPEVAELDEEYAHRLAALPAYLRSRDGRLALPATADVVNLDARELLADAYETILAQVADIRDTVGYDPHGWADVIPYLLRHVNTIRHHPAAESIHDELTFIAKRMEKAVDRRPSPFYAGPCQARTDTGVCHRDLYGWENRDTITCNGVGGDGTGCGATHTLGDRLKWLRESVAESLIELDALRSALPAMFPNLPTPPKSVMQSWVRRGRLIPHSASHIGEPLFLGADILELIRTYRAKEQHQPRRAAAC